jgi:hypothetical protein
LPDHLVVGCGFLVPVTGVRIPVRQPILDFQSNRDIVALLGFIFGSRAAHVLF